MKDLNKYNPEGSTLRKAQLRMLEILIVVDKIFRKNNIPYFLHGGTLLGAVRHGGFIPWDDDLDIAVLQKDITKIRKILSAELPDDLSYQDMMTDYNYYMVLSKVRDKNSLFGEQHTEKLTEKGLYIDLIPIEPVVNQRLKDAIDFVYIRSLRGIHNYSDRFIEKILGYLSYPFIRLIVALCRGWVNVFPSHKWGNAYGWMTPRHFDEAMIFPLSTIKFEGHEFASPARPDIFLTTNYGDYMQIPPEDKRVTHLATITFLDEK